jgi:hypothetical protein
MCVLNVSVFTKSRGEVAQRLAARFSVCDLQGQLFWQAAGSGLPVCSLGCGDVPERGLRAALQK